MLSILDSQVYIRLVKVELLKFSRFLLSGKNVTQKVVKKKQRMKNKGQTRIIQKTIKEDSFFNFFSPPSMPEDEESVDEELEALLTTDFEVCFFVCPYFFVSFMSVCTFSFVCSSVCLNV